MAFAILVVIDVFAARSAAIKASTRARQAATQASSGDLEATAETLHQAETLLATATGHLDKPWVRVARRLPWLGEDLTAARAGSAAGAELSEAALGVLGFFTADHDPLFDSGRFDRSVLTELETVLMTAEDHAATSQRLLGAAPRARLEAVRDPLTELEQASSTAFTALTAAAALATRLTDEAPYRMLVLIENGAELRATGGLVGFVALLEVDDGELRLVRVDVVHALRALDAQGNYVRVDAPADYLVRYGSFLANTSLWLNVNLSPDFPTVAGVAGRLYEEATGIRPDAVARIDLTGIGYLLDAFGTVTVDGQALSPGELATVFVIDSYLRFPEPAEQSAYLAGVVTQVFTQLLTARDVDGAALAAALRRAVAERRLAIVTDDPSIDAALAAAGADGTILPGDPGDLDVVIQNFAANKIDLFTSETIDIDVSSAGCAVVGTVSVTITNDTPAWAATLPAGQAATEGRWWVNVYLPADATVLSVTENGTAVAATQAREVGRPVLARLTTIAAGDTSVVTFRYQEVVSGIDYRVRIEPQPLVHPATLRFNGSEPIVLTTTATHTYTTDCSN